LEEDQHAQRIAGCPFHPNACETPKGLKSVRLCSAAGLWLCGSERDRHVEDSAVSNLPHNQVMPEHRNPFLCCLPVFFRTSAKLASAKVFEPYDRVNEENFEARAAGRKLIAGGQAAGPKSRTFVYVNDRLEGNAISIIAAMMETFGV
jgi:hypothetical protein